MKKHSIDIFNTPRFMLISEKNQIDLLQRLHDLLQHGFTLSESFKFLLQHIKIKSPKLISLINTRLDQGAQCYEILLLLKYPKIIIMLIYFSELFSELTSTLPHAKDYLIRNNKAKQQLIRTLQYPLLLITIFIGMLIILNHTIIPEFQALYNSFDIEISKTQLILSSILIYLPKTLLIITLNCLIFSYLFYKITKKLSINLKYRIILKIPILRTFLNFIKLTDFLQNLHCFIRTV